jgi:hypothetical protein
MTAARLEGAVTSSAAINPVVAASFLPTIRLPRMGVSIERTAALRGVEPNFAHWPAVTDMRINGTGLSLRRLCRRSPLTSIVQRRYLKCGITSWANSVIDCFIKRGVHQWVHQPSLRSRPLICSSFVLYPRRPGMTSPTVPPRYAFRLEDLRVFHLVRASCHACGHKAIVPNSALRQGRPGYTRLMALERHLRCRKCGARGTASLDVEFRPRRAKS